ncbi:cyclic nucleotide-gated ion channel 1 [Quercus suber]|uniref:Cyclic nucleotide-gated ion channel 1 n=1 Tax=Quercus suber TaxID=58331 RepID=A0AAW0JPG7_QUESU
MPSIFSEMRRTKSSNITILNSLILLQYGPRVFQIYRYWKQLKSVKKSNKASLWIKASSNLFLYILAAHVLGAFWYFFSTQRLTACWHKACEIHGDGVEISFNCDHSFRKLSFLDDFCAIDTPNPRTFAFGIFLEARQSGILESTGFPQKVVMPSIFSEMRRTKSSNITILNSLILLQYGPRVFQIYRYWKQLKSVKKSNKASLWIKASSNLFLYILAAHVLGAFWYFFSTQRLTACWHKACEIHGDGVEISFNCDHSFRKLSFLDDFCAIDTPNPRTFAFGIFLEARQSGILESTGFPQKVFYCFSWGMRNLRFAHNTPFTIPYQNI